MIMKCFHTLILACFVALTPSVSASDKPAGEDDLAKLQGQWVVVSLEHRGHPAEPAEFAGQSSVYEKNRWTWNAGDKVMRRGIITLDSTRTPKAINTWDSDGPHEDETVPGIYQLDGDTLKLCFAMPGEKRPTEFTTKSGTGSFVVVYKRKKT
jgi:uncharacterized protein (TIGR03067 family)